jgi:peroxiredoxin Q/BCP
MAQSACPVKMSTGGSMLKLGDKAPAFRLQSDENNTVSLKDFRGKRVLLFFFPKANTSG